MKNLISKMLLSVLVVTGMMVKAQDNSSERLGLPGDNLNLFAVMKLFQESETLEGFEKNLNAEDSKINNLDLDNDGQVDYIRVIDYPVGDAHSIVMRVAMSEREDQDVAVFTVEKDKAGNAQIQLIGDEELYGKDYIVEPYYSDDNQNTPNPGYAGNKQNNDNDHVVVTRTSYVEVAAWPIVRVIYLPDYVVWRSPWYWGYYPHYWHSWSPYYWDYYYGYHYNWYHHYYGHYRYCHTYRYSQWNDNYYHKYRVYSPSVRQYREAGRYNTTYTRPDLRKEGRADFEKRNPDAVRRTDRSVNPTGNERNGTNRKNDNIRGSSNNDPRNNTRNVQPNRKHDDGNRQQSREGNRIDTPKRDAQPKNTDHRNSGDNVKRDRNSDNHREKVNTSEPRSTQKQARKSSSEHRQSRSNNVKQNSGGNRSSAPRNSSSGSSRSSEGRSGRSSGR
jgi:hypothetical protein